MTKQKAKPKVPPWSSKALDYGVRANWPRIAQAMFWEAKATMPSKWDLHDIETLVWMDEQFGFDCSLYPKLWAYLHERIQVLILRAETKASEGARVS
jgi:hypothetical protein